jgi:hypothetical protein
MDSMSEADFVVVTDTGSDDGTVERLRERGAIVYVDTIAPWRFDVARNLSLDHIPLDVDICVCTDLDEVFQTGWRNCIEKVWKPDIKFGTYLYNWSLKEDGTPDIQFHYFKIHARKNFRWVYPIHEVVQYIGKENPNTIFIPGVVLNHYPDSSKSRGSYLPLLELAVKDDPFSDRMTYYLGREYLHHGKWENCIATLKTHLSLPTATWAPERCASMRCIAQAYFQLGKIREAFTWYYKAISQLPTMREPYVECAKMGYALNDWATVLYMVEEALKIKEKSSVYINMGYSWDHTLNDLGAICCYQLGLYEKSLAHAIEAVRICPTDERLANNLKMLKEKFSENHKESHTQENHTQESQI